MGSMFRLYQSNRLEHLAERLAEVTSDGNRSPFAVEEVVVPHPGMGRWLALRLAERQGICANMRFPLPGAFIWDLFRRLLPGEIPARSGFESDVLAWRIAAILEALPEDAVFEPLQAYLMHADERMRHELAQRIAEVFDQYLVYRPDWILEWEKGRAATEEDAWQAALWQRLAGEGGARHWVYWQQRFYHALDAGDLEQLPRRLSLFAIQTLSPGYLHVLQRLAERVDIHLFLLNPSEGYWTEIVSESTKARRESAGGDGGLYLDVGNPLLSSLGGQGRDFFATILELDPGSEESFEAPEETTLLARLQSDILRLASPEEGERVSADTICADPSLQIHACHSPMREVEVLQDRLLDLFERQPGLTPDQVLVMTPDIATYTPYIEAVFGEPGDRPAIPFQLADRPGLDAAPLVRAFLELLRMPLGRFEADRPLAVLEVAAVQRRFGIVEGDMPCILRWVRENAIRWGQDADHRNRFRRGDGGANSWRTGLDRLLLGYALGDGAGRLFGGLAPYAGAEGDVDVMGALQEFMARLFRLARRLRRSRPLAEWGTLLLETLDGFFQPAGEEEAQLQLLRDLLAEMLEEARLAAYQSAVSLERLLWLLEQRIGRTRGLGGFLRGGVTFSALTPQRSLPFEVICLVGMNDGSFPRDRRPPDFDLMQQLHRPGDRSRRADDRYLFLETLLSARQSLIISYVGQDIGDNSPRPPSVVVSELIDYLARLTPDAEARARVRISKVVRHPLQPFNRR
ncbi:MAG TPA: exodeoxyribonuclease V subunit gamma, partial [Chromatiales bacterium]|nr:exodeoxyribonuclease V subunit gamma [Chromatiales bacterium]